MPKIEFWQSKLESNRHRDLRAHGELEARRWSVLGPGISHWRRRVGGCREEDKERATVRKGER